jgi:cyclase
MKRFFIILLLLPLATIAQRDWANIEIGVSELAPGIHRLFVANSVAVVISDGPDGVLMVDAAYKESGDRLKAEMDKITQRPVRYLINTHLHADHTGGNLVFGKDAIIIAHQSVKDALSKEQRRGETVTPAFPEWAQPDKFVEGTMNLQFNGENIRITHYAGGHTQGDVVVFFPNAKVLMIADLLFAGYFPFVDTSNGGNPMRYLENVSKIIEEYPADAIVVGGHGPVFNMTQLREWHNALAETISIIRQAKSQGLTAEQMKEQRILRQWEAMGSFFITEDRWIDTIVPFI